MFCHYFNQIRDKIKKEQNTQISILKSMIILIYTH